MKFPEIYAILKTQISTKGSVDFRMVDTSGWRKAKPDIVDSWKPLWIVIEDKTIGKRIWITKDYGDLEITTANLSLDVDSREYYNTQVRVKFHTQMQMAEYLKKIFESESEAVT